MVPFSCLSIKTQLFNLIDYCYLFFYKNSLLTVKCKQSVKMRIKSFPGVFKDGVLFVVYKYSSCTGLISSGQNIK